MRDPREDALWSSVGTLLGVLDGKGRCCGRKPIQYKRPTPHQFCPRCNRAYDEDGLQIENWAWWKP
jgi:hypothetical protein